MPLRPIRTCCLVLCLTSGPVLGTRDISFLCDDAARAAAADTGIPLAILLAITRVETGRGTGDALRPWPWAINQAGEGHWFDSVTEATAAAETALAQGSGNLDIGCFQLNHRWHGGNFTSLDQMFDPKSNARYAATFLSDLYREKGDWSAAIAAYHSRSAGPAATYLAKIDTVLAELDTPPDTGTTGTQPRHNAYPLLQAGARGSGGSLVPRQSSSRPLFGATP